MENNATKPIIYVHMLGEFSITMEGHVITDYSNQSKKPWELLEYLITYRNRVITPNELVELFWGGEVSANPIGALKTLLFRSRKLLTPLNYPPQKLIVQNGGSYSWTKELKTVTDVDTFEELCSKSEDHHLTEEARLSCYKKALSLYKGDFLPKTAWESWTIPISTYYHSLYQNLAHKILHLLLQRKEYQSIIDVCQQVIRIEPFDEEFHYDLIYALFQCGDQHGAMEHYNHTIELFYNEFAITPSDRLKELYKIIRDKKHGIIEDLTLIQEILLDNSPDIKGAYYCEPSVFKDIYQLESRSIKRSGDSIYLCLLTLSDADGRLLKSSLLIRSVDELGKAICSSIRTGDCYTRYSISQYLILLPIDTHENGAKVLKRIIQTFHKNYNHKNVIVKYSLQKIDPK